MIADDLMPGDVITNYREDVPVLILAGKEPSANPFGLPWFKFWARRLDTDGEGFVAYGPGANVELCAMSIDHRSGNEI